MKSTVTTDERAERELIQTYRPQTEHSRQVLYFHWCAVRKSANNVSNASR